MDTKKTFDPYKENTPTPPTILTIFGATGELSSDYLIPALFYMDRNNLLPEDFRLICVGRKDFDSKKYLEFILKKSKILESSKINLAAKKHFQRRLTYFKGDFEDPLSFRPLSEILEDTEKPGHQCYNRLYYFATSPQFFASIARILKEENLLESCTAHQRQVRVLVEKPFGFNQRSAHDLNQLLLKFFKEDQIYRIDHYLGKETVQNLMVVRFANSLFEPLWNKDYIDHVEINVLEKEGVGSRGPFYDQTGALKDMLQNHILQMLSLIAMNEPKDLSADYIRDEKLKILEAIRPLDKDSLANSLVRGQYQGYQEDIGRTSQTETFMALKVFVDMPRWRDVPFYLRTGKKLYRKLTEISIHFREPIRCLFKGCAANVLTFRIQPDEAVLLRINNKIPGFGMTLHQGDLNFSYQRTFQEKLPPAYERLLLDFIEGDQRLFIRSDEIEAAWKFVDSINQNWDEQNAPLRIYKPGSDGPYEAVELIKKDMREWRI